MGGTWGPSYGTPIPLKAIICSKDPVAADTYCSKLMGFNPLRIGHIKKSAKSGVGNMKYVLKGDDIQNVDFEINKFECWAVHKIGTFLQKRARTEFRSKRR